MEKTSNILAEMTDMEIGLTSDEVEERIIAHGYNEIPEKKEHAGIRFFKKFWGLTPWMLEITILLEWLLGKYFEMSVVIGLLIFNAALGFFQEGRANSALELLRQKLRINARVKRNGKWQVIAARELVPGDIVRLRAGDFVPSDITAEEGIAEVDQSTLTGESRATEKRKSDILYSGSVVRRGEITGIVSATGVKTYFGRTVELIQLAKPKLHMEEVTSKVVKWLVAIVTSFLGVAIIFTVWRGAMNVVDVLPLAVVLMVSAIPVALPTMFTISIALGSLELMKRGILITRLSTIEDAATMDILCADKTGTMTMNKLSVVEVISAEGYDQKDVLFWGALASKEADQDPIDMAFISAAKERRIVDDGYSRKRFVPFDPSTRKTEAEVEKNGQTMHVLKGAVNILIPLCSNSEEELLLMQKSVEQLCLKGCRAIGVAISGPEMATRLTGIVFLYDSLRADSPKLLSELKDLSLKIKILTGDALPIAREVMRELGLGGNIGRIPDLKTGTDDDIVRFVEKADGFAEIYPEDKYFIVSSLQKAGHVVAMTGDGVNDAPALRQAEVGIAVSNATDVAKKAAGAVLTTEGLEGIVDLVKIGRMTYQRIITWILNKIVKTFQITVFVVLFFLLTGIYVISALHMILLLFLTDFVTLSLSTDHVRFSKRPDDWNIIGLVKVAVLLGIIVIAELLGFIYVSYMYYGLFENVNQLQTFTFELLIFMELYNLLIIRERGRFWNSRPSSFLFFAILIDLIVVYCISMFGLPGIAPIHPAIALSVPLILAFLVFLINDPLKVFLVKKFWPSSKN